MNPTTLNRLYRALRGQQPGGKDAVRVAAAVTARDRHPTRGSDSVLQSAAAGRRRAATVSLNVARSGTNPVGPQGSLARAFCFDVEGFGWDQGEFS